MKKIISVLDALLNSICGALTVFVGSAWYIIKTPQYPSLAIDSNYVVEVASYAAILAFVALFFGSIAVDRILTRAWNSTKRG